MPDDFAESLENFEELEQNLELFDWTIGGVHIWKLLRLGLFIKYRQIQGLLGEVHPEVRRMRKSKFQLIKDFPRLFLKRNPMFARCSATKRVVIPHSRKQIIEGRLVDPISYPAWSGQKEETSLVLEVDSPLECGRQVSLSYDVLVRLAWIRRQGIHINLRPSDYTRIKGIEDTLQLQKASRPSILKPRVTKAVKAFLGLKYVFSMFLRRARPSHLYLVVAYGKEAPISAARELGIEVIEFQHGALGRGHLAYDFKNWGEVPYFPDRVLAFGGKWFANVHFPSTCRIDPVGALYIENIIKEVSRSKDRNDRQLLIISQAPAAKVLVDEVVAFCHRRPDWQIIVRPHPSENSGNLENILAVELGPAMKRVTVDKEAPLAQQAAESTVVLGACSTAILEAQLAGCKVALLQFSELPFYYKELINDGNATLVESGCELADIIDELPGGEPSGYFAEPVSDPVGYVETVDAE